MGALELIGRVVSTAMQKTVKVEIKRWWTHPKYNVVRPWIFNLIHLPACDLASFTFSFPLPSSFVWKQRVVRRKHKLAHDEEQKSMVGDIVRIQECRPISKLKSNPSSPSFISWQPVTPLIWSFGMSSLQDHRHHPARAQVPGPRDGEAAHESPREEHLREPGGVQEGAHQGQAGAPLLSLTSS